MKTVVEEIRTRFNCCVERRQDMGTLLSRLELLQRIVDQQAKDKDLWCLKPTSKREYALQQALRRLHVEIEE